MSSRFFIDESGNIRAVPWKMNLRRAVTRKKDRTPERQDAVNAALDEAEATRGKPNHERNLQIYKARLAGATYREIGDAVGLSVQRTKDIAERQERVLIGKRRKKSVDAWCGCDHKCPHCGNPIADYEWSVNAKASAYQLVARCCGEEWISSIPAHVIFEHEESCQKAVILDRERREFLDRLAYNQRRNEYRKEIGLPPIEGDRS